MTKEQKAKLLEQIKVTTAKYRTVDKKVSTLTPREKEIQELLSKRFNWADKEDMRQLVNLLGFNLPKLNKVGPAQFLEYPALVAIVPTHTLYGHNYILNIPLVTSFDRQSSAFKNFQGVNGSTLYQGEVRPATDEEIDNLTDPQLEDLKVIFI